MQIWNLKHVNKLNLTLHIQINQYIHKQFKREDYICMEDQNKGSQY